MKVLLIIAAYLVIGFLLSRDLSKGLKEVEAEFSRDEMESCVAVTVFVFFFWPIYLVFAAYAVLSGMEDEGKEGKDK